MYALIYLSYKRFDINVYSMLTFSIPRFSHFNIKKSLNLLKRLGDFVSCNSLEKVSAHSIEYSTPIALKSTLTKEQKL